MKSAAVARNDQDYDYPCNANEAKPVHSPSTLSYRSPVSSNFIDPKSSYSSYRAGLTKPNNAGNVYQSPLITLQTVVPAPSKSSSPMGCYYDVPKNIPVNPLFVSNTSSPLTTKFPTTESTLIKPKLPQKSSTVINKISSYSPPASNYSNSSDLVYMNKGGTLTKQSTSKPLPPLPGECKNKHFVTVDHSEKRPVIQAFSVQDDDDDDDCDYDYDYVCLESKKKLDDEDENVKKIISKDLQAKYEHLALNSSGLFDLQNLEKSLQSSKKSPNASAKAQFLQSYRHFLSISLKNFESWAKLDLEIIERSHPPSVYINFTKHILLSGQNLLLVAKSLNRHFGQIESLSSFADSFYDNLRQIVLKTKKSASVHPSNKSTEEMAASIRSALLYANKLNIDFAKFTQLL